MPRNNLQTQNINHSVSDRNSWKLRSKFLWKAFIFVIKLAVLVFSGWYLYVHVILNARFKDLFVLSLSILHNPASAWLFASCLALGLVNWSLETLKWQFLIRRFAQISFPRAFAAILSGSVISLWMPNRVGEYIGRVFFLDPKVRIKSIFATFVGSISQLVITLILGSLGFMFFEKAPNAPLLLFWVVVSCGFIFIGLLLFFYFNIRIIRTWLPAKNWAKKIRKYLLIYKQYSARELETVLLYSLSRYMVFSVQFYVLLVFFGIPISFPVSIMLISMMYLVQTVSPTSGFSELVVRGGATVFLFQAFAQNMTGVLAASYSIWIINLLIPSLVGAVIFGFARINKKLRDA